MKYETLRDAMLGIYNPNDNIDMLHNICIVIITIVGF